MTDQPTENTGTGRPLSEGAALVAWLDAAITAREEAAQASAGAPWSVDIPPMVHVDARAIRDNKQRWGKLGYVGSVERDADRAHVVLNDPSSVLRRCAADRKLLKLHGCVNHDCVVIDDDGDHDRWVEFYSYEACPVIELLAEGYGWTGDER